MQASKLADRLLAIDHSDRISRLVVGIRELKKKHYALAREDFAQSVRGPVTDLTATLLSAWALAGQGDTHAAIDTMDKLSGPDWYGIFKDLHAGLILDLAQDNKAAGKRYDQRLQGRSHRAAYGAGLWPLAVAQRQQERCAEGLCGFRQGIARTIR